MMRAFRSTMESCSAGLWRLPDPTLPGPVPPAHPHGLVPDSTELTLSKNTGDDDPDAGADKDLHIHTFTHIRTYMHTHFVKCIAISHLDFLVETVNQKCYAPICPNNGYRFCAENLCSMSLITLTLYKYPMHREKMYTVRLDSVSSRTSFYILTFWFTDY